MSGSLTWFELKYISKTDFITIFKDYSKPVGKLGDIPLTVSISNLEEIETDIIQFEFQHDFKHSITVRERLVEYPFFHKAKFWTIFNENKSYILANGQKDSINYLNDALIKICSDYSLEEETMREIDIEPMKLDGEHLLEITRIDALKITARWFLNLGEREKSAFLSGTLKDENGNESDTYRELVKKAEKSTAFTFKSRKLGYSITISKSKISSKVNEANNESLVKYFKDSILNCI